MSRANKLGLVAACTAALWVFPSFGTQGMGTLQQAYAHEDRRLFVDPNAARSGEMLLRAVDRKVGTALLTPSR